MTSHKTSVMYILRLSSLLVAIAAVAAFHPKGDVIELTPDNFDKNVRNGEPWIVEFMAPWCKHCKSLKPHYTEAAKKARGVSNFGVVDAEKYRSLSIRFGIFGFPTLFHINNGTEVRKVHVAHSSDALYQFASRGWQSTPVSYVGWTSPMGLWGTIKFHAIYHAEKAFSLHQPIADHLGLPPVVVLFFFVLCGVMGLAGGLIGCAVMLGPKKPRAKPASKRQ